jgi:hypothetical protein
MEKQPNSHMCFLCGIDNPIGLKLRFYTDDEGRCIASFQPKPEHQGYPGHLHGALIGTLLHLPVGCVSDSAVVWPDLRCQSGLLNVGDLGTAGPLSFQPVGHAPGKLVQSGRDLLAPEEQKRDVVEGGRIPGKPIDGLFQGCQQLGCGSVAVG